MKRIARWPIITGSLSLDDSCINEWLTLLIRRGFKRNAINRVLCCLAQNQFPSLEEQLLPIFFWLEAPSFFSERTKWLLQTAS